MPVACMQSESMQNIHKQHQSFRFTQLNYIRDYCISLSTIVLNSRDWSEIVWLPKILRFKINLAISFIRKKLAGIHWLGYNDAVSWLNKAKTLIFQPQYSQF